MTDRSQGSTVAPARGTGESSARRSVATPDARDGRTRMMVDEITGLANRAQVEEYLALSLARRTTGCGVHTAVLHCDIDRFRVVNDSLGRDAGDELLRLVGQRLQAAAGSYCGDDVVAGRIAGDEFAVVCGGLTDSAEAAGLAHRLQESFATAAVLGGDRIKVHITVGIVVAGERDHSPDELLRRAETAHAQAKQSGAGMATFDARMQRRAHDRLRTELDLTGAAARGELRLHYQPITSSITGRVRGLEALVRWQHPRRGMVPPIEFIPLAEETGLIHEVGAWVMRTAFAQSRAWYDDGVTDMRIGINVSARQLTQDGFVDSVATLLDSLDSDQVLPHMELTESALMTDPDRSAAVLNQLKALGVRLSLDDFGTGYSSMAYLQQFPVDILKIDRQFIDGIHRQARNRALVAAMVQLGHALDLEVLAEGIETEAEKQVVQDLGCDLLQGYVISRPLPADEIRRQGMVPRRS